MKTPRAQAFAMVELTTGGQFVSALDDANRQDFRKLFKSHPIRTVTIGHTKDQVLRTYPTKKSVHASIIGRRESYRLKAQVFPKEPQKQKLAGSVKHPHHCSKTTSTASTKIEHPVEAVIRSLQHYLSPAESAAPFPSLDPELSAVVIEADPSAPNQVTSLAELLSEVEVPISDTVSETRPGTLAAWLQQPAPTPSALAARRLQTLTALREEIRAAVPMLTAAEIARATGHSTKNPRVFGQRLREQSALAVREANSFKFPAFQFLESGKLHPRMKDVLQLINVDRAQGDIDDGWPAMIWMYSPTSLLAGQRPMDIFVDDAEAVLDAAQRQFGLSGMDT